MIRRYIVATLAFLGLATAFPACAATPPNISYTVGVCDPSFPTRCSQAGPFVPDAANTAVLAVTTSTARVALPGTGATVILTNNGAADMYLKLGGSTVTAATTDFFLGSGRAIALARGTNTYVAGITASSSTSLVAQTGWGVASFSGGGGSGGGGGGGAVTIADGADVTQGAQADLAWTSGAGTVVSVLKAIAGNSAGALPAGSNTIGSVAPLAVTPAAGTASTIATGGTAVTLVTGPVKGCYITNPTSATDQGIGAAENGYINPVTTATTTGNGTNLTLVPGQSFYCIPGQTTNVSGNAATSSHKFTVVVW